EKGVLSLDNQKELEEGEEDKRPSPSGDLIKIPLDESRPERCIQIGSALPEELKSQILEVLRNYSDVFAWSAEDMPGIDSGLISHQLSVPEDARPIKQKLCPVKMEKHRAICSEVEKLLQAGFIREVSYPDWLANVVMVKKSSKKWRMCVDYTDLNRACPKDSYPLPSIDMMVDSTAGHAMLSFMDAYSGYHQVRMHPADEEKTSFIVAQGTYCYRMMPFGLKNAGATFQRLVDKVFAHLRGKTVEAYVDDIVIKSKETEGHPQAMIEAFETLRKHQMKLNPEKCAFGVSGGKFLGFLVSERGIEANPEKSRLFSR
nr:reverse transcriptase family protein [Serratia marcescens]